MALSLPQLLLSCHWSSFNRLRSPNSLESMVEDLLGKMLNWFIKDKRKGWNSGNTKLPTH